MKALMDHVGEITLKIKASMRKARTNSLALSGQASSRLSGGIPIRTCAGSHEISRKLESYSAYITSLKRGNLVLDIDMACTEVVFGTGAWNCRWLSLRTNVPRQTDFVDGLMQRCRG